MQAYATDKPVDAGRLFEQGRAPTKVDDIVVLTKVLPGDPEYPWNVEDGIFKQHAKANQCLLLWITQMHLDTHTDRKKPTWTHACNTCTYRLTHRESMH